MNEKSGGLIMKKFFLICSICIIGFNAKGQKSPGELPVTMPFGKVSKEDLELKSCDFEPDANAEVLFDKGDVSFSAGIAFKRHIRIKVFNDRGKDWGSQKIEYIGISEVQQITDIEAETINLNNGNIEVFKVEKKDFYKQRADRTFYTIAFSMPNVQPGSVLDITYTVFSHDANLFPDWYFQSSIPTRYSEFKASIPGELYYKPLEKVTQPYAKNTEDFKAMVNIPSLRDEPFMGARKDNLQHIQYLLGSAQRSSGGTSEYGNTWKQIGKAEIRYTDFGQQMDRGLSGERVILDKAKAIKDTSAKIAFIFNEVKNAMKWNEIDEPYTQDGTSEAWTKKAGNSTEINLILYHLLHKAGINALPMMVSTRQHGKVNPGYPNPYIFNRTVAYVPGDATNFYVLDATGKYNVYNEIPAPLLNGMGFYIDDDHEKYDLLFLNKTEPVKQMVTINAEIKTGGKMAGNAHINSYSQNRIDAIKRYKTDGEKKYIEYLLDKDNSLGIGSLKFENMEVDSLPLLQVIDFNQELTGSDENYIYFNSNLFTQFRQNPFLSDNRVTDIDFSYPASFALNGTFKIPAGYKTDALPKSATMTMPDNSISFKRIVSEEDGIIAMRYYISFKRSIYFKENYAEFHEFLKKMYEMLNEQVVLKKG